jgi:polysaccharide deacetylase 2 family uncharacterized protein YibQ
MSSGVSALEDRTESGIGTPATQRAETDMARRSNKSDGGSGKGIGARSPRADARISYHPVRQRFLRRLTDRGRLTVYAALAGGLFVFGIATGTGIGFWLAPSGAPVASSTSVSVVPSPPRPVTPEGSPVPVVVYNAESALRVYEEDLRAQPEATRPNPNRAPDVSVDQAPASPSRTAPNTVSPKPLEAPVVAALPPATTKPIAPSDRWLDHAVSVRIDPTRPMIAIVIDDLGIDQPRSRAAIALPAPVTLAFLPYGYNLAQMTEAARARGHELLVHLPMAPLDLGVDPGPNALHRELGEAEIRRRVAWNLEQLNGYVGVNNHMGSRFTADGEGMAVVLDEIRSRGLIFMDSVTTTETQGYRLAARMGVPHAVRDVFLDHVVKPDAIREQLRRVEDTARRQGHAIAIGHPHDDTLAVLRDWIPRALAAGYQLVPLSAIIRHGRASARS